MKVKVPQFPWYGDTELELDFPPSWEVVTCRMAGQDSPKLTEKERRAAFLNPIGTPRIAELARNKKEVCILFDDLTRSTRADGIVPFVLEELKEGGIKEENIRFISAVGLHGAMKLMDFQKKLGAEIPKKFLVFNHNPYENCTYLGETSRGTPVWINSEFMSCDLKIAIGEIVPHPTAGFGGGGKMILPGVAHVDTITANHRNLCTIGAEGGMALNAMGRIDNNAQRLDMEEIARMAGLDVSVNALVNLYRDTVGLFVGDLVKAHREGVKIAEKIYATEASNDFDIVVANSYAKANEAVIAVSTANNLLKEAGGDLVVIGNTPEGQICHYLARSFGKKMGGRLWGPKQELPARTKRMIALGPYIDKVGLDWIGPLDKTIIADSWSEVIGLLKASYGDKAKVAVIPDATLQYFPKLQLGQPDTCIID